MNYTIILEKQELDTIMKALGELPLKESYAVFEKLNDQYLAQAKEETKHA